MLPVGLVTLIVNEFANLVPMRIAATTPARVCGLGHGGAANSNTELDDLRAQAA
ncbi:hypothetical protein [Mycobacterium sp.]|uniref:hypothetical protein n=1 Tax=Mycobacterium sp. TaxID=1785 RepID=UPI003D135B2A